MPNNKAIGVAFADPLLDNASFVTASENPVYQEGLLFYDNVAKALSYYNDDPDVTVNIGQENLVRVYNNSGSLIPNGHVCYISGGGIDDVPVVALAQANALATSQSTLGICTADTPDGDFGYITTEGIVHGLNTSTYVAGDVLYLSGTTAGHFTKVIPVQPDYDIIVGYVTKADATDGAIFVQVQRLPWYPNLELLDTVASVALPTTPTIFKIPTTVVAQGFTYDASTGIITIGVNGSYSFTMMLNVLASSSGKIAYFYVEVDTGSGFVIRQYSGRARKLLNNDLDQVNIVSSNYFTAGTKVRFYLWASGSGVTLETTNIPGTSTATVPAARLLWA